MSPRERAWAAHQRCQCSSTAGRWPPSSAWGGAVGRRGGEQDAVAMRKTAARDGSERRMNESGSGKKELATADTRRVLQLLPHRYPFLLVDRIIDMDRDESAVGIKAVSVNEPYFQGHFPSF